MNAPLMRSKPQSVSEMIAKQNRNYGKQLDPKKRQFAARMRNATNERFWDALNILLTRSYAMAERHYDEAMSSIPGLTSIQKAAVIAKATEIRELWDGLDTITMDNTAEEQLVNGNVRR